MDIKYEDIKDIKLYSNYKEFCDEQFNCSECALLDKGLIEHSYDQPCEPVYDLLTIIKDLSN